MQKRMEKTEFVSTFANAAYYIAIAKAGLAGLPQKCERSDESREIFRRGNHARPAA